MGAYVLAHDIGTTGDKAALFGEAGDIAGSAFSGYPTYHPKEHWVEQDPADYWMAFCTATADLLERTGVRPSEIAAVSFSGQMQAALAVDASGEALRRSMIWADLRSVRQAACMGERIGEETVYELTGHRLSPAYTAAKIMWLAENEPDVYRRAFKFVQAKDYVAARLTGVIRTDFSDGSGTNLMNISTLRWEPEILEAAGIDPEKLPELGEAVEVTGCVTASAARASGLTEGTPVVLGAGDGACATCGAGVVREGDAYVYLGSSTWMALATGEPLIDPDGRTMTFGHLRRGLYVPCGTMQAGGGSLKWLKDTVGEAGRGAACGPAADAYDLLTAQAAEVPAGADGLLYLPYLMGERSPYWNPNARGAFIGLSVRHGRGHLVRAVLEGVALNMRLILEAFVEQGVRPEVIRMIGGGARSALWRSIFADVLERPTARLNVIEEATAVGAAVAGGVGVGLFPSLEEAAGFIRMEERIEPNPRSFETYRRSLALFRRSYSELVGVFEELADQQEG